MPRTKNSTEANLWPAAGLTALIFALLILTGLVLTFGFIQQLQYLARERSLQEAESSLAAQKALLEYTTELREALNQYSQQPFSVSEDQIHLLAQNRYQTITQQLPKNPRVVIEALADWSEFQIPSRTAELLETRQTTTFKVVEKLAEFDGINLYLIQTSDEQVLDFYSAKSYGTLSTNTEPISLISNIAFEKI